MISGVSSVYQDPYTGSSSDQLAYATAQMQASTVSALITNSSTSTDLVSLSQQGMNLAASTTDPTALTDESIIASLSPSASGAAMPDIGITSLYQAGEVGAILSGLSGQSQAIAQQAFGSSSSTTLNTLA